MKRGIEKGRQQVPPILNRCMMHNLPTYPRIIQVADGRWIEMWCCPMWDQHTKDMSMQQFPDVERFTDKVQRPGYFSVAVHQQMQHGAGMDTAISRAIPKPRLSRPQ